MMRQRLRDHLWWIIPAVLLAAVTLYMFSTLP